MLRLGMIVASVIGLAWTAEKTLSSLFVSSHRESGTFSIEAMEKDGAGFRGLKRELRLQVILADGRLLRWDSTSPSTGWETVNVTGNLPVLRYMRATQPALLTFQGKRFVAILQDIHWTGVVRVKWNGETAQVLDLQQQTPEYGRLIAIEDPAAPPSVAVFVGALILFSACAWWFGPIPAERGSVPWLVFFLSLLHLLFWVSQVIGTNGDSTAYLKAVEVYHLNQPVYPPPGYPALVGLVGLLASEDLGRWLALVQHGMIVLGAVWMYALLRRFMREDLALLGALLGAAAMPVLSTAQNVMSEAPSCFAMIGALYFGVRCAETGKIRFAALAGGLVAFAILLRVAPAAGLVPALCMILYPVNHGRRQIAIMLTIVVAIVSLPILWYSYRSGDARLTDSTGEHLFNRVIWEQKLVDDDGSATRRLRALIAPQDPRDLPWWEVASRISAGQSMRPEEIEPLLRQASMEGIRKSPWKFLAYTPELAWRLFVTDHQSWWIPRWGETPSVSFKLETPPLFGETGSSFGWRMDLEEINRRLWPIICWLAVAGLAFGFLSPQRCLILSFAWVPIGYLLLSAAVESFAARYNVPVTPFIAGLAMLPLDWLCKKLPRHITTIGDH